MIGGEEADFPMPKESPRHCELVETPLAPPSLSTPKMALLTLLVSLQLEKYVETNLG